MSSPYDHRGRFLEPPLRYSEEDGSSSAQASENGQDASTHQYHCDDYQEPNQQATQQSIKRSVNYSGEQYGSSDEDSYGYPEKNPYSDSSDSDEESFQNPDEQCNGLDADSHGNSQMDPYSDSDKDSVHYPAEQSNDPDEQYPDPDEETNWYPQSNPYDEFDFSPDQERKVRIGIALGKHPTDIAWGVERDAPVVEEFIAWHRLTWTPEQNKQLMESVNEQDNMSVIQELLLSLGSPIRLNDEIQARVQYLASLGSYAQRAELTWTPQPDPQEDPMCWQPEESMPPQASLEEVVSKTETALKQPRRTTYEIETPRAMGKGHGSSWAGVEEKLPGRSNHAIQVKWASLRDSPSQQPANLSPADISFLKNENAKGFPISGILADRYPGYKERNVTQVLRANGWSVWTRHEDHQVSKLRQQEGDDWAQISNKCAGKPRSKQEVKNRWEFLRRVKNNEQQRKGRGGKHHWTPEQDSDLGFELARGKSFADVAKRRGGFYGLDRCSIRHRARAIAVDWTEEDDDKLWDMDLTPDASFDWDSVGRQYKPERKGYLVEARWKFLQGFNQGKMSEIEAIGSPQHQQVSLTQKIGNLGLITTSHRQDQRTSLPRSPMSTYRSLTHTAPGQLNGEDDRKLREAVATGASFRDIKNFIFGNRFDISPEILADRAREIHAEWSPGEDYALLQSLSLHMETDDNDDYVGSVHADLQAQGLISKLRSFEEVRARTKHLMDVGEVCNLRNAPGEGSFEADGQPYYISAHPATDADHATRQTSPPDGQAGRAPMAPEEFEKIKCWIARGYTCGWIGANCDPRRTTNSIQKILDRKYKRWTLEQDKYLVQLKIENDGNLAEIRRELSGPERSEGEILERLQFIEEGQPHEWRRNHQYLDGSSRDEDYVRLQLTEGIVHSQKAGNFRGIGSSSLERLATPIGATWSEEDDQKLRDKVLGYEYYGLEVDWEYIGQQYDPLRPADIVEIRWKYLRGIL